MNTRDSYKRRVAKLEKRLQHALDDGAASRLEHARQREHYADVVAKHIANERRGDGLLLQDRFKIQELEQQVGSQHVQLCNANEDAKVAKLNYQVVRKELDHLLAERKQDRMVMDALNCDVEYWKQECRTAERSLRHRVWVGVTGSLKRAAHNHRLRKSKWLAQWGQFKRRIVLRLMVLRLNKPRVDAMHQAGYIPEKLVKVALDFWEHDKARIEQESYIRRVHSGTNQSNYEVTMELRKPSMWRRMMILIGRA